jgi:hypothetical protein
MVNFCVHKNLLFYYCLLSLCIVTCKIYLVSYIFILFIVIVSNINRNCDMLPLSLEDLLNYKTLMLKFYTNKPIWALLPREVFFWGGGKGAFFPKKGVMLHPQATDFQEKKSSASSICIVSYCKYDMYFNKYDMNSIVGIDKKTYEKGIGITYIHT